MSTPALGPVELLDPDRHDTARFSSDVEVLDHWLRRVAPVAAAAGRRQEDQMAKVRAVQAQRPRVLKEHQVTAAATRRA